MEPINKNLPEDCDPVEIIDQKSGLEKFVYMCTKPLEKRVEHYKKHGLHFWTDLVLAGTVIVLLAVIISLYAYNKSRLANMVDFQVAYDQARMINGSQMEFAIAYKNTSKRNPAIDATVALKLPKSLHDVRIDATEYNEPTQTITLGTLAPQSSGEFKISGLLIGNLNQKDKFLFVLSYSTPSGLAQQEFTSRDFSISQSVISASVKLPTKIIIGSAFPATVVLENTGDLPFQNLRVKLAFPPTYAGPEQNELAFEKLDPHSTAELQAIGSIAQARPGTTDFGVQVLAAYGGEEFVLSASRTEGMLDVSKVALIFANPEKTPNINPGDQANVTIVIENNESAAITNLSATLSLEGAYVDEHFLQTTYGQRYANRELKLESASDIQPKASITDSIQIAALPFITVKERPQNPPSIIATIKATYSLDGENLIFVNSQKFELPINSTLGISSSGIFTTKEGDQIGIGSIPPRPGEYTAYWAILQLTNGVNKVRNVTLRATVPDFVAYEGISNVTHGVSVRAVGNGKTLEWYIPELDAYDGILNAASQARIQLAIVPEDSDIGKSLPLLTNITVTGIDDRTGYTITGKAKDVTTAIFNDPKKDRVAE